MTETVQVALIAGSVCITLILSVSMFASPNSRDSNFESIMNAWTERSKAKYNAQVEIERIKLKSLEPYKG